jgi:[ribosomal protein S5]-alanine N-acetyltransferase
MSFILETPRLIVRELTPADTDDLLGILSDPVAMRYYPQTYNREETEGWITRSMASYEKYGHGLWAVDLKESGNFAGVCGIMRKTVDEVEENEIGYLLLPRYWNQGYATEAARGCLNYAFESMGRTRMISLIRPDNEPSRRVAERNGLTIEKQTIYKDLLHDVWSIHPST